MHAKTFLPFCMQNVDKIFSILFFMMVMKRYHNHKTFTVNLEVYMYVFYQMPWQSIKLKLRNFTLR